MLPLGRIHCSTLTGTVSDHGRGHHSSSAPIVKPIVVGIVVRGGRIWRRGASPYVVEGVHYRLWLHSDAWGGMHGSPCHHIVVAWKVPSCKIIYGQCLVTYDTHTRTIKFQFRFQIMHTATPTHSLTPLTHSLTHTHTPIHSPVHMYMYVHVHTHVHIPVGPLLVCAYAVEDICMAAICCINTHRLVLYKTTWLNWEKRNDQEKRERETERWKANTNIYTYGWTDTSIGNLPRCRTTYRDPRPKWGTWWMACWRTAAPLYRYRYVYMYTCVYYCNM